MWKKARSNEDPGRAALAAHRMLLGSCVDCNCTTDAIIRDRLACKSGKAQGRRSRAPITVAARRAESADHPAPQAAGKPDLALPPPAPGRMQHRFVNGNCAHCHVDLAYYRTRPNPCIPYMPQPGPATSSGQVACPKCRSTQIAGRNRGFGFGKAIVGLALVGGAGLLVGGIGSSKVVVSCLRCGHSWPAGQR